MGSLYERASRKFIEGEILLHFDMIIVRNTSAEEKGPGNSAWEQLRRDMGEEDGWKMFGVAKLEGQNLTNSPLSGERQRSETF